MVVGLSRTVRLDFGKLSRAAGGRTDHDHAQIAHIRLRRARLEEPARCLEKSVRIVALQKIVRIEFLLRCSSGRLSRVTNAPAASVGPSSPSVPPASSAMPSQSPSRSAR